MTGPSQRALIAPSSRSSPHQATHLHAGTPALSRHSRTCRLAAGAGMSFPSYIQAVASSISRQDGRLEHSGPLAASAAAAATAGDLVLPFQRLRPTPPCACRRAAAGAGCHWQRGGAAGGVCGAAGQPAVEPRGRHRPPARGLGRVPGPALRLPGSAAGGQAGRGVRQGGGSAAAIPQGGAGPLLLDDASGCGGGHAPACSLP